MIILCIVLLLIAFMLFIMKKNISYLVYVFIALIPYQIYVQPFGKNVAFPLGIPIIICIFVIFIMIMLKKGALRVYLPAPFIALAAMNIFAVISIPNALNIMISIKAIIYLLFGLIIYMIVANLMETEDKIFNAIRIIVYSSIFVLVIGILEFVLTQLFGTLYYDAVILSSIGNYIYSPGLADLYTKMGAQYMALPAFPMLYRVRSLISGPIAFSIYLGLIIPLAISLLIFKGKTITKNERYYIIIIIILALANLVFTYSRGGWAALCVVFMMFYLKKGKFQLNRKAIRIISIGFIAIAVLVSVLFGSLIMVKINAWNPFVAEKTYVDRADIWRYEADLFLRYPLTGVGVRNFIYKLAEDMNTEVNIMTFNHNSYLGYLVDTGIFGFVSYVSFIMLTLYYGYRNIQAYYGDRAIIAYGLFGSVLWVALQLIFDEALYEPKVIFLFYVVCALIMALYRLNKRRSL